jgi:hypothetical protein
MTRLVIDIHEDGDLLATKEAVAMLLEPLGRPRFMRNGHAYTPQKTRDYEGKVVQCWKCQSGKGFADGIPLRATVTAFFKFQKARQRKRPLRWTERPTSSALTLTTWRRPFWMH